MTASHERLMRRVVPPLPWWQRRAWRDYLQTHLLRRCRRRFTLHLSPHGPLGTTDQARRQVYVNPLGLPFPEDPAQRALVRHAPVDEEHWQQQLAIDLVEHEAGHVRFSGNKPEGTLGWLWNSLEDARQERLMVAAVPENRERFERLGDTAWLASTPTGDLLAWCLLWRWECSRSDPEHSRMDFDLGDWQLWELAIRPLVERAWVAPSSDDLIPIAEEILDLLGRDADAEPPQLGWCSAHGQRHDGPDPVPSENDTPAGADLPLLPGPGAGIGADLAPGEADPAAILEEIEGAARELARTLRPPAANARAVPHPSRGDLLIERAMVRSRRPFEHHQMPAPARSLAIQLLIDESGSMSSSAIVGTRAWGAVRAAMLLDRACELARVPLQLWGFEADDEPHVVRTWSDAMDDNAVRRRIAGITGRGGTLLAPVLTRAMAALQQRPEQLKWLVLAIDGELDCDDATEVRGILPVARRSHIHVQPVFIGTDTGAIETVRRLFGACLEAPSPAGLAQRLSAWIRAVL